MAAAVDGGDPCGAAEQARSIRDGVIGAVNEGRVPAAYQEELSAAANELVSSTEAECTAAQPSTVTEDDDEDGKGKGKGKDKQGKKDAADDEPVITDTVPVIVVTETDSDGDE